MAVISVWPHQLGNNVIWWRNGISQLAISMASVGWLINGENGQLANGVAKMTLLKA
jgi:hypothetical protein